MSRTWAVLGSVTLAAILAMPSIAGVVVHEEGNQRIEIGGRAQLQYRFLDPEDGDSIDDLFFRRLRTYVAGTVTENWFGKIQLDFGEAEGSSEMQVKDAYMRFSGLKNHTLTVGNAKTPFSREILTSSKKQQLIDFTFVGNHNFGTPDRQLGLLLDGHTESEKLSWAAAVGSESHDPSIIRMDFESPVNRETDWNQGWVAAARLNYAPHGSFEFSQGDFHTDKWTSSVSLAVFTWRNDDDNNTYTDATGAVNAEGLGDERVDLDTAFGGEFSAGVRGYGLSIDFEYQVIEGETVDPTFTGGLYLDGETQLDKIAVEGGFMLKAAPLEFVVGWESLDADNYEEAFERKSFGFNWFMNEHKVKWQNTFRQSDNFAGIKGADLDEFVSQFQFVF